MLEELSPDAWSGGDHFDIFESDAPGLELVCTNLDNGSPDARSVVAHQETVVGATPTHIPATDDGQFVVVQQENMEGETLVHGPTHTVLELKRDFAAIPEASTPSRKSKRRAQSTDEHSLDRVERIKATQNLDFNSVKGNSNTTNSSFVHLLNDFVTKNL
jgi:hypothetical protein